LLNIRTFSISGTGIRQDIRQAKSGIRWILHIPVKKAGLSGQISGASITNSLFKQLYLSAVVVLSMASHLIISADRQAGHTSSPTSTPSSAAAAVRLTGEAQLRVLVEPVPLEAAGVGGGE
jgi:hypothetical protein